MTTTLVERIEKLEKEIKETEKIKEELGEITIKLEEIEKS